MSFFLFLFIYYPPTPKGHSAQYCTYTVLEQDTMDIISVVNVDKRQTDRKSVAMEKYAFIKTFDRLMGELSIKEIVTDAHLQIAALMHKINVYDLMTSVGEI